ncbi:hypothetical protein HOA55_03565 [archaeon]|nr:hypothetical protein [archaeon]MBT3577348.1 hypothetical protein [archaeon]MBT6820408.1 hypothetical protein [archaeon]MBT7025222.1 hypothetical protein [archaeon]MBT7238817.1 hypothetical protein [archaeon]
MINWLIWLILALLILFGVIAILMAKKGKKRPTDYYNLFVMGVIWLPFGIIMIISNLTIGIVFIALGASYMTVGLAHKDKWDKNHKTWNQLGKKERKLKQIILIVLGVLLFIGLLAVYMARRGMFS